MMPGAATLAINQVQLWNECNKKVILGGLAFWFFMSLYGFQVFSCHFIKGGPFALCSVQGEDVFMPFHQTVPFALRAVLLWT